MKVFFDTNVWLSALVFPGLCAELLATVNESEHELLTSKLIQSETIAVLERKFASHVQAIQLFNILWANTLCVPDIIEPKDDADARLVAAAAQAGVELFVTGDQRVLGWHPKDNMAIVSPREAWAKLFMIDH